MLTFKACKNYILLQIIPTSLPTKPLSIPSNNRKLATRCCLLLILPNYQQKWPACWEKLILCDAAFRESGRSKLSV